MDDQPADASLVRERALLLEALTLLVQRQAESDAALTDQLERTSTRVAAIERRSIELENRLVHLDERLSRLATEVEPDPGLPRRLAVLQAHVERLGGHVTPEPPVPPPPPPVEVRPPRAEAPRPVGVVYAGQQEPEVRAPVREAVAVGRPAVVPSGGDLWTRLGASNQDRASVVLIGAGVLVVAYALLAQLRVG